MRGAGRFASSVFLAVAALLSASAAFAGPALNLTLTLSPGPPPIFPNLSGLVQFYAETFSVDIDGTVHTNFAPGPPPIDIGKLLPGGSFGTIFIPVDPCFAGGSCGFAFGFGGMSGQFPAFAFDNTTAHPNASPGGPPIIPIGFFDAASPGSPPIFGDIVGYDDSVVIGSWEAQIVNTVPEPSSASLLIAGLVLTIGGLRFARPKPRLEN